jgi:hypothetical protein
MDFSKLSTSDWIAITGGIAGVLGGLAGILGAIVSGIAAYITWLMFKRDRADIKLQFDKDREIIGPSVKLRGYKPNTLYIYLSVINKGRRRITIDNTGVKYLKLKGGFIFSDSMIYGSRELNEGKRVDYLAEQNDIDFSNISSFYAKVSIGNTYIKNYAPFYKRLFYTFLDKTHLRIKLSPIKIKAPTQR